MAESNKLRIEPSRVGQVLGGKYPVVVACPKCHLPAWRQSENVYVHAATITLGQKNNPQITVHASCKFGTSSKGRR